MKKIIILIGLLIVFNISARNKVEYEYDDFKETGMWVLTCDIESEGIDVSYLFSGKHDDGEDVYVDFTFYFDDWCYLNKVYVKYVNKTTADGKSLIAEINANRILEPKREVADAGDIYCRESLIYYMSKDQFYETLLAEEVKFRASGSDGSVDFYFKDKAIEKIQEFYDKALTE